MFHLFNLSLIVAFADIGTTSDWIFLYILLCTKIVHFFVLMIRFLKKFQPTAIVKMWELKRLIVTTDALTQPLIPFKDLDAMLEVKAAFADSVDSTIFLRVKIANK